MSEEDRLNESGKETRKRIKGKSAKEIRAEKMAKIREFYETTGLGTERNPR